MIEVAGQGQLTFQGKIQNDVRALGESVGVIEQEQSRLQDQIQEVKNSAETMSNALKAAFEQLEGEISRSRTLEQPEAIENESPELSALPSETNSID